MTAARKTPGMVRYVLVDGMGVVLLVVAAFAWSEGMSALAWAPAGIVGAALVVFAAMSFVRGLSHGKQSER